MKAVFWSILAMSSLVAVAATPDWAKKLGRSVEGGHIIQIATGQSDNMDVAIFKAQQGAIKSLRSECGGWAHKDIIPGKTDYVFEDEKYTAYAEVAIRFAACEFGKTPMANLQNIDNPQIRKAQDLYDLIVAMDSKGEKYSNLYARIGSFQTEMQQLYMQMKSSNEEFKKDMEKKYAEHLAEVKADNDILFEELNAARQDIEYMKRDKARAERLKREGDPTAKYSAAKKKCIAELRMMDTDSGPMDNDELTAFQAKQTKCREMDGRSGAIQAPEEAPEHELRVRRQIAKFDAEEKAEGRKECAESSELIAKRMLAELADPNNTSRSFDSDGEPITTKEGVQKWLNESLKGCKEMK